MTDGLGARGDAAGPHVRGRGRRAHEPGGPFLPDRSAQALRVRWWVPLLGVGIGLLLVGALVRGEQAYRTLLGTCLLTTDEARVPAGWERVDERTFRHGDVVGTIDRIRVDPPFGLTGGPVGQARLDRQYAAVRDREIAAAGGEPAFLDAVATPLDGNVGRIWAFDVSDAGGERVRVDHVMHPPRGGCGWLFRAELDGDDWERQGPHAASFPDRYPFAG